jgi:hypothetical protein
MPISSIDRALLTFAERPKEARLRDGIDGQWFLGGVEGDETKGTTGPYPAS